MKIHKVNLFYPKKFKFSIAPFSFFQTNTKATEVLYNTVIDLLQPDKQDTLLDMYCGTGAIGICLSPHVKSVIGVEQVEESIESAKHNAQINNIKSVLTFPNFVLTVLPSTIGKISL